MRIISLRCNGLVSAVKEGLIDWIADKDADVVCLQDVRVREYKVIGDIRFYPKGFDSFYFEGEKETVGGVAILTRHKPKAVMRGLGSYELDREGRYIQADFEHFSVVSVLPPSPWEDKSNESRQVFIESLESWMRKIRKKRRHFIFCGDFGAASRTQDLEEWHKHNVSPGFRREDRLWLVKLIADVGYVDAYRQIFGNELAYSWFPDDKVFDMQNPGAWRTDLQLASVEIARRILAAGYASKQAFGDRIPLIVDYDLNIGDPDA